MHWIVRLPDGTCTQIPSSWSDHAVGDIPIEKLRAGGLATPESLRSLIQLLANIVRANPNPTVCPCMDLAGDRNQHEQQLLLFDPGIRPWVRELWSRVDAQKRQEILTMLANMATATLKVADSKEREDDDESQ